MHQAVCIHKDFFKAHIVQGGALGHLCSSASSSRPPATLAARGRFLTVVCVITVYAFPSITFLRGFPGFIAKPFRGVGTGFKDPHLQLMF